jgi:hypothetical protein
MFAGGVATRLAPLGLGRLGLAALAAVVAGAAAAAILDPWLGVIDGAWIDNWAALSLIIGAIAAVVVGLAAHLGRLGIALAGFAMVLVANVFSGIASAPELLPEPVGALGQLMPAGAGGNLLRSTAFFDGAAAADHALVLAAWTAAGIAALIVAVARTRLPLLLNPDDREPAGARARP